MTGVVDGEAKRVAKSNVRLWPTVAGRGPGALSLGWTVTLSRKRTYRRRITQRRRRPTKAP